MFNDSIHYIFTELHCDSIPVAEIIAQTGTPAYLYSLPRALTNYAHIRTAFSDLDSHIHYSAKANANLAILRTLVAAGAGIDAVSGGEIYRALKAGAPPDSIVFAGVGKSPEDLRYAVTQGIGWFNVENVGELDTLNALTAELNRPPARIALRFNPDVAAATHPNIATGHGSAKFGLTETAVRHILQHQPDYPHLDFAGIHLHIGSQLHDIQATTQAVEKALALIAPYPHIRTVNIGGGLPVAYAPGENLPAAVDFAAVLTPLLQGYTVLLEPGRSIIADAGILVTRILYVKRHAGQTFYIVDAGMTDLIRPMLYNAQHQVIPVSRSHAAQSPVTVVGPICETTDILAKGVLLPEMQPGDLLAVLTCGAYGMVMSSNYNARPRPVEIVTQDAQTWKIARQRETWDDLLRGEL